MGNIYWNLETGNQMNLTNYYIIQCGRGLHNEDRFYRYRSNGG